VPLTEEQWEDQPSAIALPDGDDLVPSGIAPLDERLGGLQRGGSYVIIGTPRPAKMVAAFQFLYAGLARGEACVLLSNGDRDSVLTIARAWGFDLEPFWTDGSLKLLGFKDDFELRAIRSVEPEEVVEELDLLVEPHVARLAVDPGSLFISGGTKSLLGSTFLKWARHHPATVCTTFSVDGTASMLPSSADWLVNATTGRLVLEWQSEELYELTLVNALPTAGDREQGISVQLKPGGGLVKPETSPARRGHDRPGIDENRLLLVSLGGDDDKDVGAWAERAFKAEMVSEPFEAVARVQDDASFGGVLIHAPRALVREAAQACRALRPLTRAAIVFASDDAVRSTDRIQILEAGADDCLSGGIDFRELDMRLRQAITAGFRPVPSGPRGPGRSSPRIGTQARKIGKAEFVAAFEHRAADPARSFFAVLDVASDALERSALEEVLMKTVRSNEGDLVATNDGGCLVLLQGARPAQLGPFLDRLRSRIAARAKKPDADVNIEVMSHPTESDRIRSLLGV